MAHSRAAFALQAEVAGRRICSGISPAVVDGGLVPNCPGAQRQRKLRYWVRATVRQPVANCGEIQRGRDQRGLRSNASDSPRGASHSSWPEPAAPSSRPSARHCHDSCRPGTMQKGSPLSYCICHTRATAWRSWSTCSPGSFPGPPTSRQDDPAYRSGYVQDTVLAVFADPSEHAIYICGSPLMITSATHAFVAHGAICERIYSEGFTFQPANELVIR